MYPPEDYLEVLHTNEKVRNFLHKLYSLPTSRSNKNKRKLLLEDASAEELDYTIKTLHYLLTKKIHVVAEPHGRRIKRSKILPHLEAHFLKEESTNALIQGPKWKKVEALLPISCYHQLFWLLFNKRPR